MEEKREKGSTAVTVWKHGKSKEVGVIRLHSRNISVDGGPNGEIKLLSLIPGKVLSRIVTVETALSGCCLA